MPKDYFWIDGQRCDAVGIQLQGPVTFSAVKPNISTISVPGRSGDLHTHDGSYQNITGKARCFILQKERIAQALDAVTRWSLLQPEYHTLEVTDEPDTFRKAIVTTGPKTEVRMHVLAPFDLSFDCKPQKYYKRGQWPVKLQQSGTILHNPGFPALPLLTVYGSGAGSVTVGGITVQIKALDGSLTLDCDTQNAYKGTQNKNSDISAPVFPTLPPGDSPITWTGGVQRMDILPRWWTL